MRGGEDQGGRAEGMEGLSQSFTASKLGNPKLYHLGTITPLLPDSGKIMKD